MNTYHKIQTVLERNPDTKFKTVLEEKFSLPEFEYLKNNQWEFTEKIDGTNIRIIINGDARRIEIKGKTDKAQIPEFLLDKLKLIFTPQISESIEIFEDTPICLYGEGYGNKIQKIGNNYNKDNGFVLFDIKIGHFWLKRKDIEEIASKLKLEIAPIIGIGTLAEMIEITKKGFNSKWGNFLAEGIVARPKVELIARNGRRIITKIKHKDFDSIITK